MNEPKVTTKQQMGSVTVNRGGKITTVPIKLTITTTEYPDGRRGVTIKVPTLRVNAKTAPNDKES